MAANEEWHFLYWEENPNFANNEQDTEVLHR
jgi:hypothetical protein